MAMRLMARTGPREGASFPLPEGEFTIGRDTAINALPLETDPGVSRQHCVIEQHANQATIRDLVSLNGTYVNDVEAHDHRLAHGDEIQVGDSVFVVLVDGEPAPLPRARIDLDDGEEVPGSTVTLRPSDPRYVGRDALLTAIVDRIPARAVGGGNVSPSRPNPSLAPASAPLPNRIPGIMRSVINVCRAVSSVHRVKDLQRRLLESVLEAVPASRAAIVLGGGSAEELTSALHWTRSGGETRAFRIPRRVIQGVLEDRAAVCINDALNSSLEPSRTIVQANIGALMAVAIVAADGIVGALYVDATDSGARFSEDDLHLLLATADVAAVPLANAMRAERLEQENERLIGQLAGGRRPLLGSSERMRAVHRFIAKVADGESTVLIAGASGTGKELVARAIHHHGARANKPFVGINCAAVTESLLESEFFGHEKGAFTSAYVQKKGKLEEANGGTVFLDEIGELAPPLQAKLLRVLQEREFVRVGGGTRPIKINVRFIAATNRDLAQEIRRGAFRQDLYFRLNVVSVTMPELREHPEDIPLLAMHFLEKHAEACARRVTSISAEALSCLVSYDWPGNVRELENAIERAIVLGTTEQIVPEDLPESIVESGVEGSASGTKFHETIRNFKRQIVTRALEQSNGNFAEAAKLLGLHPNNLHRLLKSLNLK
jgi:transcriptional regulator with GAF, ATPase, and Fis domain